jgi:hypothetical protein
VSNASKNYLKRVVTIYVSLTWKSSLSRLAWRALSDELFVQKYTHAKLSLHPPVLLCIALGLRYEMILPFSTKTNMIWKSQQIP